MQDQVPMTIDGEPPAGPRRLPRGRVWAIAGAGAVVLTLGGGAVALAASQNGHSATTAAYGYGGPGAGPEGGRTRPAPGVHAPHLEGKVKSVSGTSILITDRDGFTRTIVTSSATKYSDSLTASPAVGTEIHAEGKVDANGTSLDATSIGKFTAPTGGPGAGGPGRGHGPGGPAGTAAPKPPTGTAAPSKPAAPTTTPTPAPTA